MELVTKRETLYGGPLGGGKRHQYVVYLKGQPISNGSTKDEAQARAKQALSDARIPTSIDQ